MKKNKPSLFKFLAITIPLLIISITLLQKVNLSNKISMITTIISIALIIYLILLFFADNDSYALSKKEFDSGYYKSYLDIMIDGLVIANIHMDNVKILDYLKDVDVEPYLKKIEGVYIHLSKVSPPNKYNDYHEDILFELKTFIDNHKKIKP